MRLAVVATFVAALVAMAMLAPVAGANQVTRTCGLLPGDGAYSYVKSRGVKCRTAGKIAFRARRRFCARRHDCLLQGSVATTHVYRGRIGYRGWSCRIKVGWELLSVRCAKGNRWLLRKAAS